MDWQVFASHQDLRNYTKTMFVFQKLINSVPSGQKIQCGLFSSSVADETLCNVLCTLKYNERYLVHLKDFGHFSYFWQAPYNQIWLIWQSLVWSDRLAAYWCDSYE